MRISALLLAIIGSISLGAAQSTNDKNNFLNCIVCIDQNKKWDSIGTKCVDNEGLSYTTSMQGCATIYYALQKIDQEIYSIDNQMKLGDLQGKYKELPNTAGITDNLLYIVGNSLQEDLKMWATCSDDTNVVMYGTTGDSATTYSRATSISCGDKIIVPTGKTGFILIMMKNGGKATFSLQA